MNLAILLRCKEMVSLVKQIHEVNDTDCEEEIKRGKLLSFDSGYSTIQNLGVGKNFLRF